MMICCDSVVCVGVGLMLFIMYCVKTVSSTENARVAHTSFRTSMRDEHRGAVLVGIQNRSCMVLPGLCSGGRSFDVKTGGAGRSS